MLTKQVFEAPLSSKSSVSVSFPVATLLHGSFLLLLAPVQRVPFLLPPSTRAIHICGAVAAFIRSAEHVSLLLWENRRVTMKLGKATRRFLLGTGMAAALISVGLMMPMAATAVGVSMTPSATLASGQGRAIRAAWGANAPYKVTFHCNVTNCTDYVTSSTTSTSVSRYVILSTCTGAVRTSPISITETGSGSTNASTTTTWTRGTAC